MKTEFEVKILDIEVPTFKENLEQLGAKYIGKVEQKRYVYDFDPVEPNKWLRLRQTGDIIELTIKEIVDDSITGTQELEVNVSDFETMHTMLKHLGYTAKAYQENTRESYVLDGVEIEIDYWPLIPAYVEIEGEDQESVEKIISLLGYTLEQTTSINTKKVYSQYGIDLSAIDDLRFES